MQLSRKAKIVLGLGVLLIVALIIVFVFNKKPPSDNLLPEESVVIGLESPDTSVAQEDQFPVIEPSVEPSDSINYISPTTSSTKIAVRTPQIQVKTDEQGIRSYKVQVTPAPNAGPYDWTRTNPSISVIDIKQNPASDKSLCQIAELSDKWSNIFEKSACDLMNFLDEKIFDSLATLTCSFTAGGIQAQTGRKITGDYKNGMCLIFDRNGKN